MAIQAAEREATSNAQGVIVAIQQALRSVEHSVSLVGEVLESTGTPPAQWEPLVRALVESHPDVFGSTIALVPGPGRAPVAPYAYRRESQSSVIMVRDLAAPSYRYWEHEWFTLPIRSRQARWSEPYLDEGGGDVVMVTYSVPVGRRADGQPLAIATADLDLVWLNKMVATIQPGRTGFGVVLSPGGRVLAHPAGRWAQDRAFLDQLPAQDREIVAPLVSRMLKGDAGFERVTLGGQSYRLRFAPAGAGGWSVAVFYPEDVLFAEVRALRSVQTRAMIAGLIALAAVVIALSSRLTRPLKQLALSAGRMGTGDLDLELPPVKSRDEVGSLTAAFHQMRNSLRRHIADLKETTAAKERLESEVKVARRIQLDMLPSVAAAGEGFELNATLVPARVVGGDLYDHFARAGRMYFMVGDVSGKGIPAALFMARTKTLLGAIANREPNPAKILEELNRELGVDNDAGMFVTAVVCALDASTGELLFACAGHDPPLVVPARAEARVAEAEGGIVLGLVDRGEYPINRLQLNDGDAIVLYTDGVSEAQNTEGDFFGVDRLRVAATRSSRAGVSALAGDILGAIREFAGAALQSDDITILVMQYRRQRSEPPVLH